jgi:hypothetical protein
MTTNLTDFVTGYIQAVGDKRFDRLPAMLQPEADFGGPGLTPAHGAAAYIAGLERLGPILLRNEIKHIVVQGDEACVVYDFITDTPAGAVACVEWLKFEQGRIRAAELTFDRGRWPEVMQVLQARLAAR